MAGAGVVVAVEDQALTDLLRELHRRGTDLTPVFADFGEHLLMSHDDRFASQQAPDGTPWVPLSPRYQARKPKNADKILILEGLLSGQLSYDSGPDQLLFGSNQVYAATHQFGDAGRGIPARSYFGMTDADEVELIELLRDHLGRA